MIPPELPRNRGAAPRAQFYAARQPKPRHTGAAEQAGAVLPANEEPKPQGLHAVAADLEQISLAFNKRLQFVVDHDSNEVTVKVIDRETDKVIKELPPEELQRLHSKLKETIGFLFDERV
jgi:flagellar protein FlaG